MGFLLVNNNFHFYKILHLFSIMDLLFLLICGFVWLLPMIMIVNSTKTSGSEKLAWILAMLFVSWGAWIFYILLAPIKKQ